MNHTRLLSLTYSGILGIAISRVVVLLNYALIKPLCTQENNRMQQLNCHTKELQQKVNNLLQ